MFGLFKKNKIANSIRLAVKDIVTDHISANECQEICGNRNAAAFLCTELMIHKLNALAFVVSSKYEFADLNFIIENFILEITKSQNDKGFVKVMLDGLIRMEKVEGHGPERIDNMYKDSAKLVLVYQHELNEQVLVEYIGEKVKDFIRSFGKYFK